MSCAVSLVVSRFSTRAVSPRKFPPADDSRESSESSSSFSLILNSFCCLVNSAYIEGKKSHQLSDKELPA